MIPFNHSFWQPHFGSLHHGILERRGTRDEGSQRDQEIQELARQSDLRQGLLISKRGAPPAQVPRFAFPDAPSKPPMVEVEDEDMDVEPDTRPSKGSTSLSQEGSRPPQVTTGKKSRKRTGSPSPEAETEIVKKPKPAKRRATVLSPPVSPRVYALSAGSSRDGESMPTGQPQINPRAKANASTGSSLKQSNGGGSRLKKSGM